MELNHLPSGYEPPALTDELQPRLRHYTAVIPVGLHNYNAIIAKASHKLDSMQKINIRKFIYHVRHKYLTFNNLVILTAFLIAAGWVWGSLQVMQRNYNLQKEVDYKRRQLQLTELQKQSLELQQRYYQTDEFRELAAREALGLVMPGEKLLILPDNSEAAKQSDKPAASTNAAATPQDKTSNMEQWLNFLFGGYSRSINSNSDTEE